MRNEKGIRGRLLACCLSLIGFACSAAAEPLLEEEAILFEEIPSVFGASKYEQKVTEAPSRISIVTGDEIRRFGYRTLSELLRSLPGFSISNDRNYAYTGVRGFSVPGDYDTRLLQLVDGHRINDNIYGSLFSDQSFPVDLNLIERVEVIRGPSSSLYGSGAFFGVVNVVTRSGRDVNGWEFSGTTGSHDARAGRFAYGNRLDNGLELVLSGTAAQSDGNDRLYYAEFDDPSTNNGIAEGVDDEDFKRLFGRLALGDFELEGAYSEREKGIPTASYGTMFNADENRTWDGRSYLSLKYQTLRTSGAEVLARVHYDEYEYEGEYLYHHGEPGEPGEPGVHHVFLHHDEAEGRWWGGELQWRRQLGRHHVVAGAEFRDSLAESQRNLDHDGIYLDIDTDQAAWALYVQDEVRLLENLALNVGLRRDDYDEFGSATIPRAALIWTALPQTTVKALYGEAFRAPNAYELYFNDNYYTQKPSDDLDPETIRTAELVLEQQLGGGLRGVVSLYENKIDDLIALTTDPADGLLVFVNQGNAEARGYELELEKRWRGGAVAALSYSHQNAEDDETGERLVNYPEDMLKLNLIATTLGDRLGAALEAQYETGRRTLAGGSTDSRTLVNLSLFSEQWVPGLDVTLTYYNLLDTSYSYPGSEEHAQDAIEQDGRTFKLQVDYAF